jgi:SAM-dependent methyltransferase
LAELASLEKFNQLVAEIGEGVPDTVQYQLMSGLILDFPEARRLAAMDPFAPGYKDAALELYLLIRGRAADGYVAARDESAATGQPANLWTGLVPWSFQDGQMLSEHLLAWAHIFQHLNLPKEGALLEYGPGSGQILLMAARLGYRACGVDINEEALTAIRGQAEHLALNVALDRAEFGQGFAGERFDTILFYEAFHHAFSFEDLLTRLHERIKPGGRVVLCGEPIVSGVTPGIPYPWGPRLDALSVFCMRRFGWMELGFTHEYFLAVARAKGWAVSFHPGYNSARAVIYVLEPMQAGMQAGMEAEVEPARVQAVQPHGWRRQLGRANRLLRNPRAFPQKLRAYIVWKLQ